MKRPWFALLAVSPLCACEANNPTYFMPPGPLEVGQQDDMNSAATMVTLDFRSPTSDELKTMQDESKRLGYTVPWLHADREGLELLYTVTNLDNKAGEARVEIDGASELYSYDTSMQRAAIAMLPKEQQKNAPAVLSLIRPTPVIVQAGQSVSGIVGEDDFTEAALDLDAIGRWMAVPAQVLINRSETNPIGLEMVPRGLIRPALYQIQVTFTATSHMRLEFLVRVRDEDRVLHGGQGVGFAPHPKVYMHMLPMPAMPAMMMPATPTPMSMPAAPAM